MDIASIGLRITSNGLKTGVNRLRQLEGEGARTERGMSNLKGTVAAVSAAFAALGAQAFARDIIREADQLNRNLLRTQQLIDTTGRNAERSAQSMHEQARQIALATLQSTEGVMQAQQTLLTFRNITGETFDQAIEGAVDLSSAMRQDLNSAVLQLGKALEDPVKGLTALSDSGTVFTDAQKEMVKQMVETNRTAEAQQFILGELAAQYGGVAAAEAQGLAGAQDTLGQRIQEAKLELADQLNLIESSRSAYNVMSGAVVSLTDNMDKVIQVAQALTVLVGARLAAALTTATAAKIAATQQAIAYQGALARMAGVSATAAASQTALAAASRGASAALLMVGGPVGAAVVAVGALYYFREELGLVDAAAQNATNALDDNSDAIRDGNAAALDATYDNLINSLEAVSLQAQEAMAQLTELEARQAFYENSHRGMADSVAGAVDQQTQALAGLWERQVQLQTAIRKNREAREQATTADREAARALEDIVVTADAASAAAREAARLTKTMAQETEQFATALQSLQDRLYPVAAAARQYQSEQALLTQGFMQGNLSIMEYLDALQRLKEAQQAQQAPGQAYGGIGFGSQIGGPGAGNPTGGPGSDPGVEKDPFAEWLQQAESAFTNFDQLQAEVARNFTSSFGNMFADVVFQQSSFADGFQSMMQGLARSVVAAIGEMIAQWLAYQAVTAALGFIGGGPAGGLFAGFFDKGGRIPSGQVGMAGEYGPELVRGPAQVTSRRETAQMMQGGGVTVNVNNAPPGTQVSERTMDGKQIIDVFVADMSSNGRSAKALQSNFGLQRQGR